MWRKYTEQNLHMTNIYDFFPKWNSYSHLSGDALVQQTVQPFSNAARSLEYMYITTKHNRLKSMGLYMIQWIFHINCLPYVGKFFSTDQQFLIILLHGNSVKQGLALFFSWRILQHWMLYVYCAAQSKLNVTVFKDQSVFRKWCCTLIYCLWNQSVVGNTESTWGQNQLHNSLGRIRLHNTVNATWIMDGKPTSNTQKSSLTTHVWKLPAYKQQDLKQSRCFMTQIALITLPTVQQFVSLQQTDELVLKVHLILQAFHLGYLNPNSLAAICLHLHVLWVQCVCLGAPSTSVTLSRITWFITGAPGHFFSLLLARFVPVICHWQS